MPNPTTVAILSLRRVGRFVLYVSFLTLALECGARVALGSDAIFERIASSYDEPSWRLRWLRRHRNGEAPYRFTFDQHHPLRGWSVTPGLQSAEVFGGKRLSTNSRGLRGRDEFGIPKPPGIFRIALFGDSLTFGEDVSDEETFAQQMARLLPGVEVLNFGVHGYGHDQMLLYLREALPAYQPDVVLLGFVTDDSLRNVTTFRDFAKPRFRLREGRLELEGTPVPTPEAWLAGERWKSRFLDLLAMARSRAEWRWGQRLLEVDQLTDALLTAITREARAAGARAGIALLPAFSELGTTSAQPLPAELLVAQIADREGVPYVRLRPLFLERARLGADFEQIGHWGPLEHRIAAGGIVDFLRREALVP